MNGFSRTAIIGALVAFGAFALAAVLFVAPDTNDSLQRLGLLFAMFGTIVAALISVLRADAAARQTEQGSKIAKALDGSLEPRIRRAVRDVRDETASTTQADDPVPPE